MTHWLQLVSLANSRPSSSSSSDLAKVQRELADLRNEFRQRSRTPVPKLEGRSAAAARAVTYGPRRVGPVVPFRCAVLLRPLLGGRCAALMAQDFRWRLSGLGWLRTLAPDPPLAHLATKSRVVHKVGTRSRRNGLCPYGKVRGRVGANHVRRGRAGT